MNGRHHPYLQRYSLILHTFALHNLTTSCNIIQIAKLYPFSRHFLCTDDQTILRFRNNDSIFDTPIKQKHISFSPSQHLVSFWRTPCFETPLRSNIISSTVRSEWFQTTSDTGDGSFFISIHQNSFLFAFQSLRYVSPPFQHKKERLSCFLLACLATLGFTFLTTFFPPDVCSNTAERPPVSNADVSFFPWLDPPPSLVSAGFVLIAWVHEEIMQGHTL